jgi:predicted nuclease of restriction endonuclease-like RecB superfamily
MKLKTRNKFEAAIAKQLRRSRAKFKYESERIPYVIAGHYIPDFTIRTPTGTLYVEAKGHFRPEDKRKLAAVKRCNPHLDIRILFYRHVKSSVKWAERHGFRYAVETIPKDWLKGL